MMAVRSFDRLTFSKIKPSPYPLLPFQGLRLVQLLSAIITSSILLYFVYHLRDEDYSVPWTFVFLLTASLLTFPLLFLTHLVHHHGTFSPTSLAPRLGNALLAVTWSIGLALFCWYLSWTLGHRCTLATWQHETGIMVCRLYKALATFAVTGTAATWAAVALDVVVYRSERRSGVYGRMGRADGLDDKRAWELRTHKAELEGEGVGRSQGAALWDGEQRGVTKPWKSQRTIEVDDFGYAVPEEQTVYGNARGASMDIAER